LRFAAGFENPDPKIKKALERIAGAEEPCLWSYDLQRVILSSLGCICDWFSLEEALSWSLVAGRKLQVLLSGWDEFMEHFLPGFGFF
jgi:hypothetical protein